MADKKVPSDETMRLIGICRTVSDLERKSCNKFQADRQYKRLANLLQDLVFKSLIGLLRPKTNLARASHVEGSVAIATVYAQL